MVRRSNEVYSTEVEKKKKKKTTGTIRNNFLCPENEVLNSYEGSLLARFCNFLKGFYWLDFVIF
jgi:hypothetical protein